MKKIHNFDIVHDSQKLYRLLLEAMSNPARIVSIGELEKKMFGENPAFLALAMTLLDNEVSFHTCEDNILSEEIISLTLSRREALENADFIFVKDAGILADVIENAKNGELADPHKSATIIVRISNETETRLKLSGPGIKDFAIINTDKAVADALALRDKRFDEYPTGIDFLFAREDGGLFAIPRLVKKEAE